MASKGETPAEPTGRTEPTKQPEHEDDVQRKFREALERKKAQHHDSHGGSRGKGVGPASNDKVTRQFRRKSG